MPRLSVDLDPVFPDHPLPRDQALRRINAAIRQSVARLKKQGFQTHAVAAAGAGETKLLVRRDRIEIKIPEADTLHARHSPSGWSRFVETECACDVASRP